MSSQSPAPHIAYKGTNSLASQAPSATQVQVGPSNATESFSQRRPGGSGSFGSGSTGRQNLASARNNQPGRKRHKESKRHRFADEDAIAESAAMKSTTSRKGQTSITHLMNFTLPPRPQYNPHAHQLRNGRRYPTWGVGSGYHAVDKARYVHANYRFIVDPRGDYHDHALDADLHLDWEKVLQILASAQTQCSACPICLSTPVAPRMAKCGHIFCLPCLIQYMHTTDDTKPVFEKKPRWKKCPICFDSIYASETRPVRWFIGQEGPLPAERDDVVLRLVMRRPGDTLALPRDEADNHAEGEDIPWHFAAEVMDYARIMKGTEDYMMEQYDSEIGQIQEREREDELLFGDDPQWTRKAINTIRGAQERSRGIGNPPTMQEPIVEKKPRHRPPLSDAPPEPAPNMYSIQHAARLGQTEPASHSETTSPSTADSEGGSKNLRSVNGVSSDLRSSINQARSGEPKGNAKETTHAETPTMATGHSHGDFAYYFYQALPHYYLSPLDIRILKAAFGDFASFPSTLLPRVDHVVTGHVIDEDLRKRAKYLAHLPLGCDVAFLECDWTDIVGPEVLAKFQSDVERRRKKNRDKEIREEKDRARAERLEENQRWAAARRKRPSISRDSISTDGVLSESINVAIAQSALEAADLSVSPPWAIPNRNQQGSAFAPLASPSTSPVTHRTVWGTPAIAPSSPPQTAPVRPRQSTEDDGWLQGWELDLLREVDAVAQLEDGIAKETESSTQPQPGTGRKKKGKKITLMSTTPRRGAL